MRLTFLFFHLLCMIDLIFGNFGDEPNGEKVSKRGLRTERSSLIAFKPFGKDVHVGLDILLPFVKVPTKRKLNENEQENALLTVNTAAITIAGLISGIGIFLGHILKSITTLQGRENVEESAPKESDESQSAEHRLDFDSEGNRFSRSLQPFKFAYRNSSGGRVETTFDSLINTIEDLVLDNHVDLNACIQKSICTLIKRSNAKVMKGDATALESIVDGVSQLDWISFVMRETAIEEAIEAGKSNLQEQCAIKYPTCHWNEPDQRLLYLISKRVRFI